MSGDSAGVRFIPSQQALKPSKARMRQYQKNSSRLQDQELYNHIDSIVQRSASECIEHPYLPIPQKKKGQKSINLMK